MSSPLSPIYVCTSIELVWVFASPLVVLWDVAYVLLRPLSMPGGTIHYPIWVPYELYGRVDHLYGVPALERSDGLVTAYAIINFLESASYIWCAWKIFCESKASPEGLWYIEGHVGNRVMLALFSTSLTVCTKTILYALNEIFSNFANVGHNGWVTITMFWILPNLPWVLVPAQIVYNSGQQILKIMANDPQHKIQ